VAGEESTVGLVNAKSALMVRWTRNAFQDRRDELRAAEQAGNTADD
jgi:hypothetical protein